MRQRYLDIFSRQTIGPHGVKMAMIGGWSDLCAYYAGSDGNAWSYSTSWSNKGPSEQFVKQLLAGKWRGEYNPQ